jgi:hypothetical protein
LPQLRDYLQLSLYDPQQGYFSADRGHVPVGTVGKPLDFRSLSGEPGYRAAMRQLYDDLQACPCGVTCMYFWTGQLPFLTACMHAA